MLSHTFIVQVEPQELEKQEHALLSSIKKAKMILIKSKMLEELKLKKLMFHLMKL